MIHKALFFINVYNNFIFLLLGLILLASLTTVNISQRNITKLDIGDGPSDQCFTTLSINILDSGLEFLVCHLSSIIDVYIKDTPNLLSLNDTQSKLYFNSLYLPLRNLGLYTMPLILIILCGVDLFESSLNIKSVSRIKEYVSGFIISTILIILLPSIFSLLIEFNNSVCHFIINLSGAYKNTTLSNLISDNIGINDINNSFLPSLAGSIIWICFVLSLIFLVIFFVVRYVVIWVMLLAYPLLIAFAQVPTFSEFIKSINIKMLQFLIVQPIFLIGLNFFIIFMKVKIDSISRFILGICCLFTLSFIPSFVAGITGGKLANISSYQVKEFVEGVKSRIEVMRNWGEESPIYVSSLPYEKPDKK